MGSRRKKEAKRRLVQQAVESGLTDVAEIRMILIRHGHQWCDPVIRAEVERAKRRIKAEQRDRERAVRDEMVPLAVPADKPAPVPKPVPAPVSDPARMLQYVIDTPMEQLSFEDFVNLKSGYDQYSRWPHRDLTCLPEYADVESVLRDETRALSCIRWMMRGLPVEKAIRKVQTDAEVAKNARDGQRKRTRKKSRKKSRKRRWRRR